MEINGGLVDAVLLGSVAFTAAYFIGPFVNARENVARAARHSFDDTVVEYKAEGQSHLQRRKSAKMAVTNQLNLKGRLH